MLEIIRLEYDDGAHYHHYGVKVRGVSLIGYDIYSDDHQYQLTVLGERAAMDTIMALERSYLRGQRSMLADLRS